MIRLQSTRNYMAFMWTLLLMAYFVLSSACSRHFDASASAKPTPVAESSPRKKPSPRSYSEAEKLTLTYLQYAQEGRFEDIPELLAIDGRQSTKKGKKADGESPDWGLFDKFKRRSLEESLPKLIFEGKMAIHNISQRKERDRKVEVVVTLRSTNDRETQITEIFQLESINGAWKIVDVMDELVEKSTAPNAL